MNMKNIDLSVVAEKSILASVASIVGFTVGHLLSYGLGFGSISGAVPADIKLYMAFAFAAISLLKK